MLQPHRVVIIYGTFDITNFRYSCSSGSSHSTGVQDAINEELAKLPLADRARYELTVLQKAEGDILYTTAILVLQQRPATLAEQNDIQDRV